MQKKLLAVAVASALGAPAVGFAQATAPATSTVQVYGTLYMELDYYNNVRSSGMATGDRENFDYMRTSGSEIGFKGEERLGGSLSAWFQCSTSADIRGTKPTVAAALFASTNEGWCSRNSALGMKGAFGNLFFGIWDTPFKRSYSIGNVGSGETGGFGNAGILMNGATAPTQGVVGTTFAASSRGVFSRREQSVVNYDSPNFGGFQVLAAVQTAQSATNRTSGNVNDKSRTMSIAGIYSAGPLGLGLTYEKHRDVGAGNTTGGNGVPATSPEQDDDAWAASAAYTFGPVKLGGVYTRQRSDVQTGAGTASGKQRVHAWHAGVDWTIVGPHGLRAAYTAAGRVRGDAISPVAAPLTVSGLSPGIGGRPNAGPNTGASMYQARYVYAFSKRTEFNLGYARINNKSAAGYSFSDMTGSTAPGQDQSVWVTSLKHTF